VSGVSGGKLKLAVIEEKSVWMRRSIKVFKGKFLLLSLVSAWSQDVVHDVHNALCATLQDQRAHAQH
jgi:hypothetical protein